MTLTWKIVNIDPDQQGNVGLVYWRLFAGTEFLKPLDGQPGSDFMSGTFAPPVTLDFFSYTNEIGLGWLETEVDKDAIEAEFIASSAGE